MIILIYTCYGVAFLAGLACILAPFFEHHNACKPEGKDGSKS